MRKSKGIFRALSTLVGLELCLGLLPQVLLAEQTVIVSRIKSQSSRRPQIESVKPGPELSASALATANSGQGVILRQLPRFLPEGAPPSQEIYEEVLYSKKDFDRANRGVKITAPLSKNDREKDWPGSEVQKVMDQGPDQNRIVLTILGDGYTAAERTRFFEDCKRITENLFGEKTFASYLSLFNVYAVFVPSRESGLTDFKKVDTAFGLYRSPQGSKRGIMPGKSSEIQRALRLVPKTDYPIVIANDDFYGGLGGQYAISTRSVQSGMIVLRHELGHNFGNVGEEYDGGYVYSGANSSSSEATTWAHWAKGGVKVNNGLLISGDYVWQNLAQKEYVRSFSMPSDADKVNYSFDTIISSVGWAHPGDVEVSIDGKAQKYDGEFTHDRSFFTTELTTGLGSGKHELRATRKATEGTQILAFIDAYAYPPDYDFNNTHIGAYATYSEGGGFGGYRPTHAGCLMRDMKVENFCSVDQENMWLRFLGRLNLVDELKFEKGQVILKALSLPGLSIRWEINGVEKPNLLNQTQWVAAQEIPTGAHTKIRAKLEFRHVEIRKSSSVLQVTRDLEIN